MDTAPNYDYFDSTDITDECNISVRTTFDEYQLHSVPTLVAQQTNALESSSDVLVVDWDGPDDPTNPQNWSLRRKWVATAITSGYAFVTPVASSIVAPTSDQLAAQFGIHNRVIIGLVTSIYVLAFAFGPLLLSPMSEIYGRYRVLQLSNLWYLAWNLACSFTRNESQLLAFRFLAGLSSPFAIGSGILGDCWRAEERGKAVAVYTLGPLLGPAIGPVVGAWIAERSTWRWTFWSTSILSAAIQLVGLFCLQETFAPLLLERKAERLRQTMDTEKVPYKEVRTIFDGKLDRSWRAIMARSLVRPFAFLIQEPIVQLLGLYMAFAYGIMYIFVTSIPSIFVGAYQQPVGIAGLHCIAFGIGLLGASQLNGRTLDKLYVFLRDKNGGVGKPEFRLPGMLIGTLMLPIGLLITGWTVEARTHWIAPDIGIVLVAAGINFNFQCIQTYIVDAFTLYAASASAAVFFLRALAGCGFPLFAPAMYSALGFGIGDTVLAAISIVIGCPATWVFWHFGERIRHASRCAQ